MSGHGTIADGFKLSLGSRVALVLKKAIKAGEINLKGIVNTHQQVPPCVPVAASAGPADHSGLATGTIREGTRSL